MITVKLRYVHEDVDRHGNVRVYFWRKGGRDTRDDLVVFLALFRSHCRLHITSSWKA